PAGESWARGWRAAAEAVVENGGKLREWTRWREAYIACKKGGLEPIAAAVAAGTLPAADGTAALRKRYCERFVRTVLDADETLRSFFGNGQDALVATFGRLDQEIADLSRRMILARLSLRAIKAKKDPALLSELALLNHEVAKKTRQLPPRTLLQRLPGLLPVLKPCLLMSPLSVAQYLPPESDGFDVVVFDEASQLTVWDAVGVLARGKQAVVVGDPKQLPPTNFFQKADPGAAEDAEPDEDAVEDLDSILDECKAAGVPEQALLWHYRSRHESLIAFSNERYYGGKLFTFPSAAVARKGLGVSRVKVEGGVYDRSKTRTNRKEAEAVVAAVVERLLDPAFQDKTCGVVTFSMAQQGLIEDLLDEEQVKHPEIQRFFDSSLPEPFFVKNLENVQGDERDAIFFSIGYAPDEKGFFAMNFGPLNRPGGERRLNVAVTRAKEEVVVFTSIDSTQIDLSRTAALGATHLREFLAYAEKATREAAAAGGAGGASSPSEPSIGDFEREVADFLRLNGYTVDERVGRSDYRVDLAVRRQPDDGGYAIGVECDGAMYRDAASARDRDESRRGVLEGLGWRMARCWCLEWWFDREGAQRKLLAEVDAAVRGLPPPEAPSPSTHSTIEL
ncbi:MAG: DNA helicase, partial [Kiritimatiellae bacterium]|nr:DNA helicase [Kiritimatiellia bacterium]